MNKYERVINELASGQLATMKCFGNSMLPILKNPSTCTYQAEPDYKIGAIVFSKVKGRFIDAHKIVAVRGEGDKKEYQIANNHGHVNGWTRTIYGRVILAKFEDGSHKIFER